GRCPFFSSGRGRHTRCSRDWSSDVCSSDLAIPLSALDGDNLLGPSTHTPWYRGPSLLQQLEGATTSTPDAGPLRLPVQWVNRPEIGRASCRERGWRAYVPGTFGSQRVSFGS